MLEDLDAAAVRRWSALAVTALTRHEQEINDLNVYPVPDGDTGTNLLLTFKAGDDAVKNGDSDALRSLARGALMGARGNSGVITAQWLGGLAHARALRAAAEVAYDAVAHPVEGTILTVARAAGEQTTLSEAVSAAAEALAHTPEQLPELAAAGVVDAGGRGLVLILEALLEALTGEHIEHDIEPATEVLHHRVGPAYTGPAYEVQFLIDVERQAVDVLRDKLDRLGDSLVVVGGQLTGRTPGGSSEPSPAWRVHVHVDDAGAAIEAALEAGRPYQITITHLTSPVADHAPRRPDPLARAVVVTASGDGIAQLLEAEGAVTVGANPSTSEVLEAVLGTGAGRVVVLPTSSDLRAVAKTAADEAFGEGVKVRVVPTRSPVQALAALAVRDPSRRFEDDVIAMAEAAGACRSAEVTFASKEALTVAGRCRPGDAIALVEGEVNLIGSDVTELSIQLLDRMLASGGELVTLLTGANAPEGLADRIVEHVAQRWPFVEVHAYVGGQPYYPLVVGVE